MQADWQEQDVEERDQERPLQPVARQAVAAARQQPAQDHQVLGHLIPPQEPLRAVPPLRQRLFRLHRPAELCARRWSLPARVSPGPRGLYPCSDRLQRPLGGLQEVQVRPGDQPHGLPHLLQVTNSLSA